MSITALVPIKARSDCKTRLTHCLSETDRVQLVRTMLNHVLSILGDISRIDRIVVMSPERDVLSEDIILLTDRGSDLNASLEYALEDLNAYGPGHVLIMPSDLAHLTVEDVEKILDAASGEAVVIAPSADRRGTNALCLPQGVTFQFCFGLDSFEAHQSVCEQNGMKAKTIITPGLEFDVDNPADLACCELQDRFEYDALLKREAVM